MHSQLFEYYNKELQYIRELGKEFAKAYPDVANKLDLGENQSADPYVERLLEGYAFLAARVHLKLDAEFPRLIENLLSLIYPDYLSPIPAMSVVQFQPDPTVGTLENGYTIPHDTVLHSEQPVGVGLSVEFRTKQEVTLWPIAIESVRYDTHFKELQNSPNLLPKNKPPRSGLRFTLRTTGGEKFSQIPVEQLPIYLSGQRDEVFRLYECILCSTMTSVVVSENTSPQVYDDLPVSSGGMQPEDALLPVDKRTFSGLRLLKEYFAFPERFLFVNFNGLKQAFEACHSDRLDIILLFNRENPEIARIVQADRFKLYCAPVINLFEARMNRIEITQKQTEHDVICDRTRPNDYEIYQITKVTGHGVGHHQVQFYPFYAHRGLEPVDQDTGYYQVHRQARLRDSFKRVSLDHSGYVGSDVFISLVDKNECTIKPELKRLSVEALCTHRDLPAYIPLGQGKTDLYLDIAAPVLSTRCLIPPTAPIPAIDEGDRAWRFIRFAHANFSSILSGSPEENANELKQLLSLFTDHSNQAIRRQTEAILAVQVEPVAGQLGVGGSRVVRGVNISILIDDHHYETSGLYILMTVLEQFFSRYASINSFTQMTLQTAYGREIKTWAPRQGIKIIN